MTHSAPPSSLPLRIRYFGQLAYEPTWQAMQAFTRTRDERTPDEIWLLEHPPVYTLGQAGKPEHLLRPNGIPVVPIDRGGQVTYHGPGQVVAYLLLDIRRLGLSVRTLVDRMEQALIDLLADHGIQAVRRPGAPGVYVNDAKIAALGLRIRSGRSYHGLSFNVDMDLSPFQDINPCGYQGLAVTQARDLGVAARPAELARQLAVHLTRQLGYAQAETLEETAVDDR